MRRAISLSSLRWIRSFSRPYRRVSPRSGDHAKKIHVPRVGNEREIEARPDRRGVEPERETFRRSTQARRERGQGSFLGLEVAFGSLVTNIEIGGDKSGAVGDHRHAAHDELSVRVVKGFQNSLKVYGHGLGAAPGPAPRLPDGPPNAVWGSCEGAPRRESRRRRHPGVRSALS